jgi:DNA modification methylase
MNLPLDQIICGDNAATLATFPDACIDLTVTSPPYDNLRTYGGHSWDFEAVAQQLWRVTKPGGVVVWVVADATVNGSETGTSFRQALRFMEIGFKLWDTMIYAKANVPLFDPRNKRYKHAWEYAFVFSSGEPATVNLIKDKPTANRGSSCVTTRNPDGTMRKPKDIAFEEYQVRFNIWTYNVGYNHTTKDAAAHGHPCAFPDSLARDHILSWSNEGDVVLDPFCGSGTTPKMARAMGRHWVGIEINPDYCEICRKRMAQQVLTFAS